MKSLQGVDVFLCENERNPDWIGEGLKRLTSETGLELTMITNRGVKVFPNGNPETFCTDHWRCRFKGDDLKPEHIWKLLPKISEKFEVIKTEHLYNFDGQDGYSMGQGQ